MRDADAGLRAAIDAIAAYLERWPHAADGEQGIAEWWLPSMGVRASQAEVHQALARLLDMKVVECATLPDGSVIYRAADPPERPMEGTR